MTLREYITLEGLKKCPKCGMTMKDCKCAKDFNSKKKKKGECCSCDKEDLDESIGLALGVTAAVGAGLIAAGIAKKLKLKKWQDAKNKTNVIRLAAAEPFQKDKVINLINIKDGKINTVHIPSKTLIEKYYNNDKEDFDGFLDEVRDALEKAYRELRATFDFKENSKLVEAIPKIYSKFYCYTTDFTNDQKKRIKETIEEVVKNVGIDKKLDVKIMVEKKKIDEGLNEEKNEIIKVSKSAIKNVQKAYKDADQRIAIGINWTMEELFGSGWERI